MNILLCTLGTSWAVIPEVYGFLNPEFDLYAKHPQRDQLEALRLDNALKVPDEIWICTSEGEQTGDSLQSLLGWQRLLHRVLPLRIWTAKGTDQLASQRECEHFRELAFRMTLKASESIEGGQLLLSLAGGRKTMSADLQRAATLFGAHRLLHVVDSGNLPGELLRPDPAVFTAPLPTRLIQTPEGEPRLMPLIVGTGLRNELLDVSTESNPRIQSENYPLHAAPSGQPCAWAMPSEQLLFREIDRREGQSSALMGNFLADIAQSEHHENWRQLYRLPTRLISRLRKTPLDESQRQWLESLPKVDLHRHLGGSLDLSAQRQVARVVWDALAQGRRRHLLRDIAGLLDAPEWEWDWPRWLNPKAGEGVELRSLRASALLLHASHKQLEHNLWRVTDPRIALINAHEKRFAAYERPGELTGSAILQHPAAIEPYAEAVVRQASKENLAYLELRGSPQKYLGGDGTTFLRAFKQAIDRAVKGLDDGIRPIIKFIIIVDRRADEEQIRKTINLAVEAQADDFVVGLDLAGDEKHNPEAMADWFEPAFRECLQITIHAGEGQSPENIWNAAYRLNADRIGHGLTLTDKPELHSRFRDRGICLELCPTSNREVVGYRDPDHPGSAGLPTYPLGRLWDEGLALTLCTDNPGISRTDIGSEYLAAARMSGGISQWDTLAMLKQGFSHAFITSKLREDLLKKTDNRIYRLLLENEHQQVA